MKNKTYGFTEKDAGRIQKTVLRDERTKALAPWRHTPILNGDESEEYAGPFAVSIVEKKTEGMEDGKSELILSVNGGFVNCNGIFFDAVEGAELDLAPGYVCVHQEIDSRGKWSTPKFVIAKKPGVNDYPVALLELQEDGETYKIHQARVFVALFMISKPCPLAEF